METKSSSRLGGAPARRRRKYAREESGAAASSNSSKSPGEWGPHPPANPPLSIEGLSATGPRVSPVERAKGRTHVLPSDYLGEDLMTQGTREVSALKRLHGGGECTPQEAQIWALGYGASHFDPGTSSD